MRSYPIDSPQAKARIIALALLADGGIDHSEFEYLDTQDIVDRLGITAEAFDIVLREFCEDADQSGLLRQNGQLDFESAALQAMLNEIRRDDTRHMLLQTIFEIVLADRELSLGEAQLTSRAMAQWGIQRHEIVRQRRSPLAGLPPQVRRAVAEACS